LRYYNQGIDFAWLPLQLSQKFFGSVECQIRKTLPVGTYSPLVNPNIPN